MNDQPTVEELVGKVVLLCYNIVDEAGNLLGQFQEAAFFHGLTSVIHLRLYDDLSKEIYLPPDLTVFRKAEPGTYRLRSTGQEIEDPDYIATWTLRRKGDAKQPVSLPRYVPTECDFT